MRDKKDKFEDDGRVIANMNIEGMPWHGRKKAKKTAADKSASKKEMKPVIFGALGAGLLVFALFALASFIFIQFCIHIWFK